MAVAQGRVGAKGEDGRKKDSLVVWSRASVRWKTLELSLRFGCR